MERLRDGFHSARRIFMVYSRETEKLKLLDVIFIKWHNTRNNQLASSAVFGSLSPSCCAASY